jgi:pyrroloquinoline quinone (PQQ) biosynthesis protein C
MHNYDLLVERTGTSQQYLLDAPIIADVALGAIDLNMYQAFLCNAYHHVRYTVPLMMATGARLAPDRVRLMQAFREYIDEEIGHEQWILNDLEACGLRRSDVECSAPNRATELLVAYVRDYICNVEPLGFFGMVHVLEGTSTSLASTTADLVQAKLGLPDRAFSYLRSHGALDVEHVAFFRQLLAELSNDEMRHVIHVANRVYHLYGDVLRSVPRLGAAAASGDDMIKGKDLDAA